MGLILALLACHRPAETLTALPAAELYTRASLDVRGVRPTLAELDAVEASPDILDAQVAALLDDERFEERVRSIYADIYLTRQDSWEIPASLLGIEDEAAFTQAVGEEPVALVGRVAATDRPWTEILTADWTMADETLALAWPTDYPAGSTGWQQVHYTDGRPAAGLLATNGFWWRYTSTESNANRGRANALSRLFLCDDYLAADIPFDRTVDLSDADAVRTAIASNPSCAYCHVSLDPLASHLYPFFYQFTEDPVESLTWHPERKDMWRQYSGVAPGYFGQPSDSLPDLARHLVTDRRFVSCAVEQAWTTLLQRAPTVTDQDALTAHREAFLAGGLTLRSLYRSILTDPMWRAAPVADDDRPVRKFAGPELLASELEALTGYRLTQGGWDLVRNDALGVRTLAGGADGRFVATNATAPSPTTLLVQERLAEAAAWYAVSWDQAHPDAPRLFTRLTWAETPADAAFTAQLEDLHRAVLGARPDAETAAALSALWTDLYAEAGDPVAAWAGVLSALLRDPAFVVY